MSQSRSHVVVRTCLRVPADVLRFGSSLWRSHAQLAAENLFLRKQLALYLERQVKPRQADDAARIALVAPSRLIDWRQLLSNSRNSRCGSGAASACATRPGSASTMPDSSA